MDGWREEDRGSGVGIKAISPYTTDNLFSSSPSTARLKERAEGRGRGGKETILIQNWKGRRWPLISTGWQLYWLCISSFQPADQPGPNTQHPSMISNHEVSHLWTAVKQKAHLLLNDHQPMPNPETKKQPQGKWLLLHRLFPDKRQLFALGLRTKSFLKCAWMRMAFIFQNTTWNCVFPHHQRSLFDFCSVSIFKHARKCRHDKGWMWVDWM